jgi:hypothetical protein
LFLFCDVAVFLFILGLSHVAILEVFNAPATRFSMAKACSWF